MGNANESFYDTLRRLSKEAEEAFRKNGKVFITHPLVSGGEPLELKPTRIDDNFLKGAV